MSWKHPEGIFLWVWRKYGYRGYTDTNHYHLGLTIYLGGDYQYSYNKILDLTWVGLGCVYKLGYIGEI